MVDTWIGTYTFQRGEAPSCPMDTFCNALYNYCKTDGRNHGLDVVGIPNKLIGISILIIPCLNPPMKRKMVIEQL